MEFKQISFTAEHELYEKVDRYARLMDTTIAGATRMLLAAALGKVTWPEEGDENAETRFARRNWNLRRQYHHDRGRPRKSGAGLQGEGVPWDVPGLPHVRGANWVPAESVRDESVQDSSPWMLGVQPADE